jgi:hypothetical protein
MKKIFFCSVVLAAAVCSKAQILGGGTQFSNAVMFNNTWLTGCPSAGTSLSNQVGFEPTTTMEACAPAPACALGTTGSDIWFTFYAQATTAKIVINPSASFNVAIQAFSGSTCPGLTDIGCIDAGGNNAIETLDLTGLTINQLYYFRVFGSSNGVSNRTGTYTFCGSTQLGSSLLSLVTGTFTAVKQNGTVLINWAATSLNSAYFEIERSSDGSNYQVIGKVNVANGGQQASLYHFIDITPLAMPVTYYRLKDVNNNGNYKYSAVVAVRMDNNSKKSLTVLSNPVEKDITARIHSDVAAPINLQVINTRGQVIYRQKLNITKGDNTIVLNGAGIRDLAEGVYILQAMINKETINTRFIKFQ